MAAVATAASSPKFSLLRRRNPPLPLSLCSLSLPSSFSSVSISVSYCSAPFFPLPLLFKSKRAVFSLPAVAEGKEKIVTSESDIDGGEDGVLDETRGTLRRCELYVCNIPRSCDIPQLLDLFKPYGTVHSVEVSRDPTTGISRGCGYVMMNSIPEAKAAIAALDGSDLGGREIRVKFSGDIVYGRKSSEALTTAPKKDIVFESPYKVYVGNLAWSVKPEDLKEHFSQFGTVVSTRLLFDRREGKNRVYGFLSFSSAEELKAAMEASGSEFHGRTLLVREVVNRE